MKRRTLLLGGVATTLGLAAVLRPRDKGQDHSEYFDAISSALDGVGQARPTLVLDKPLLEANIHTLMSHINGRFAYRVVAKSLPSLPLLETVMQVTGSNRLMLFHQPFINQVAVQFPQADAGGCSAQLLSPVSRWRVRSTTPVALVARYAGARCPVRDAGERTGAADAGVY